MNCENCGKEIKQDWRKSRKAKKELLRFCSPQCSNARRHSKEQRLKASISLKAFYEKHPRTLSQKTKEKIGKSINKNNKKSQSILDFSSRTTQKILKRIKEEKDLGCSICGWKDDVCDLHHIIPTGKGGSDKNSNLTYVCPNCHRLIHNGKIEEKNIIVLDLFFESNNIDWHKYFYN